MSQIEKRRLLRPSVFHDINNRSSHGPDRQCLYDSTKGECSLLRMSSKQFESWSIIYRLRMAVVGV